MKVLIDNGPASGRTVELPDELPECIEFADLPEIEFTAFGLEPNPRKLSPFVIHLYVLRPYVVRTKSRRRWWHEFRKYVWNQLNPNDAI